MTSYRLFLTVLFCASCVLMNSHVTHASSIQDTVSKTLQRHPNVRAAQAMLERSSEQRVEQFSGFFPDVRASATAGRIFGDNATSRGLSVTRGDGYSYLWEGNVSATQMLFDGWETSSRVRAAALKEQSADMGLEEVQESLALQAIQTHLNLLRIVEASQKIEAQLRKAREYVSRIRNMVNQGAADQSEVQQALDVQMILENMLVDSISQENAAKARYIELTGEMPPAKLLVPEIPVQHIPDDLDQALEIAREVHPAIQAADFAAEATTSDVYAEKASLYPDLDGELSYLKSDKRDVIGGEVTDARAIIRMSWNMEVGGAQLARIQQRKQEREEALARFDETAMRVETGVRVAHSDYMSTIKQLENLIKRADLAQDLFNTYSNQFEGGNVSLLQLMQSDNQVFNVILETHNTKYRLIAAQYGLLGSVGRLRDTIISLRSLSNKQNAQ